MQRFRPTIQRLPVEVASPVALPEEGIYFINGLELKRPNIISRGSSSKYRMIGVHPSSTDSVEPGAETAFPVELFSCEDTSYPIEIINSDSIIFTTETIPYQGAPELSLTLEPTVVSQPIPAELPVTYDSTSVSQSISTPIVTPIISSSISPSYLYNQPTTFEVQLAENALVEAYGQQIETDESAYLAELSQEEEVQVIPPPTNYQNEENQVRIETQADGSLVLYLQDFSSSEPITLSSDDTQIIQTDSIPVIPNQPIELPSESEGESQTYMLVPVDDQGNTVLVPTRQILRKPFTTTRPKKEQKKIPLADRSGQGDSAEKAGMSQNVALQEERPKPFRYDLPEEPGSTDTFPGDNSFMTMSLSSILPQLFTISSGPSEATNNNSEDGKEDETSKPGRAGDDLSDELLSSAQVEPKFQETIRGTFKCGVGICGKETRLKIGIINHINRCHKVAGKTKVKTVKSSPLEARSENESSEECSSAESESSQPLHDAVLQSTAHGTSTDEEYPQLHVVRNSETSNEATPPADHSSDDDQEESSNNSKSSAPTPVRNVTKRARPATNLDEPVKKRIQTEKPITNGVSQQSASSKSSGPSASKVRTRSSTRCTRRSYR